MEENVTAKKHILTAETLKKYEDELTDLKVNHRQEIAHKIKVAREQGDISENADYDAAKEEQAHTEARIAYLENLLKNAEIVVDDGSADDVVTIGRTVKLLDREYKEEIEYRIVGSVEADAMNGSISNESPLGQALLGKKVGDTVTVTNEDGKIKFKILGVTK